MSAKKTRKQRNTLILSYLGLVRNVLIKYYYFTVLLGFSEDMYQQGVKGLIMAADRFNPNRGLRFPAFATWYIRMYIREGIRLYYNNKETQLVIPSNDAAFDEEEVLSTTSQDVPNPPNSLVESKNSIAELLISTKLSEEELHLLSLRFGLYLNSSPLSLLSLSSMYHTSVKVIETSLTNILRKIRHANNISYSVYSTKKFVRPKKKYKKRQKTPALLGTSEDPTQEIDDTDA